MLLRDVEMEAVVVEEVDKEEAEVRESSSQPLTPLHQYAYSPYWSLFISYGADKENLFNNQELPKLLIISFMLVTLMCDLGVISMEN